MSVILNAPQVVIEQVSRVGREEFTQVVADPVFGLIAKEVRGSCGRVSPGLLAAILFTHGPIDPNDYT